jgi:abequosyltransferase
MTVRLSICIATYNRADFIAESLDSILAQNLDEVEVVIVDGASTDHTAELVGRYVQERPGIFRYFREPTKGGVDLDYAKAVSYAAGEYCWLFTDDDPLMPGAVARVLAALATPCSLVVVNAQVLNADLSVVLEERRLAVRADVEIDGDPAALFVLTADYLTFIGGVVIERALWLSRSDARHFGSELRHMWIIFQEALPTGRGARIIAEPLIRLRYGNAQWTSRSFEIWMFKYPDLIWSLANLPEGCRASVVPREPWRNWRRVFSFRAKGTYDLAIFRKHILPRNPALPLRCMLHAIAWFPGRLANLIAYGIFFLNPRCSKLNWVQLRKSRFYFLGLK